MRGDVLWWPFVWQNDRAEWKRRPCVVMKSAAGQDEALLLLLANPERRCSNRPVDVWWRDARNSCVRESVIYPHRLEFNLVPGAEVAAAVARDSTVVAGDMSPEMCRTLERQFFGNLKVGVVKVMPGMRWLGQHRYQPLRMTADAGGFQLMKCGAPRVVAPEVVKPRTGILPPQSPER